MTNPRGEKSFDRKGEIDSVGKVIKKTSRFEIKEIGQL